MDSKTIIFLIIIILSLLIDESTNEFVEDVDESTLLKWFETFCEDSVQEKCNCVMHNLPNPTPNDYQFRKFYELTFTCSSLSIRNVKTDRYTINRSEFKKEIKIQCNGIKELNESVFIALEMYTSVNLILDGCPISVRSFKYFDNYAHLKLDNWSLTDLANNTKKYNLPDLWTLELDTNPSQIINFDFLHMPDLMTLISINNRIKLDENCFKYLYYLTIQKEGLSEIPKHLKQTKELDLSENNITKINEFDFKEIINLEILNLKLNQIYLINENSFANLVKIREINLSHNKLTALHKNLFKQNKALLHLDLSFNPLKKILEPIFSNLESLITLNLSNINLESLNNVNFFKLYSLETLNLSSNHLSEFPPDCVPLYIYQLKKLDLSKNQISTIDFIYNIIYLSKLLEINLENNLIEEIIIVRTAKLEILKLSHNKIFKIKIDSCLSIKKIDLSHNRCNQFECYNQLFSTDCYNYPIEEINLNFNNITDIMYPINLLYKFKRIDLSHNQIKNISLDFKLISGKFQVDTDQTIIDFSFNIITKIDVSNFNKIIVLDAPFAPITLVLFNNSLKCECSNFEFMQYANRKEYTEKLQRFYKMYNVSCTDLKTNTEIFVRNVKLSDFKCPLNKSDGCNEECNCFSRPFYATFAMNCSNRNLHNYPEIPFIPNEKFKKLELHLENNFLKIGPEKEMFQNKNLARLYLSGNEIEDIRWLPPNLEKLYFDHNNLRRLDDQILDILTLSNVSKLLLNDNPWNCDCGVEKFTQFLQIYKTKINYSNILCASNNRQIATLSKADVCFEINWTTTSIVTTLVLLSTTLFFIVIYFVYRNEIKVWMYAHRICLSWVTEAEIDKEKIFDAFISYSHKDNDFIENHLVPGLDNDYELCLHLRNWIPGEFIAKQITNSICDSRRTIVVLSEGFLESVWGKMEFRTAHTQAMQEGRARVIVILLGEINIEILDNELKSYLSTNTYLQWGDPYFWNKLKYALPHKDKRNNVPTVSFRAQNPTNVTLN